MKITLSNINCLYVAFILLWSPIQNIALNFTTTKIPAFLTFLIILINIANDKLFIKSILTKPIIFWFGWVIYNIFNSYLKGINYLSLSYGALISEIIICLFVMIICMVEYLKDPIKISKTLLYSILFYGIIGFATIKQEDGRMLSNELGNALPLNLVFLIFISGILRLHNYISNKRMFLFWLFSLLIIIASGTRKAFGAILIIIVSFIISRLNKISFKNILVLSVSIIVIYLGFNFIIDNTNLGSRLIETSEIGEKANSTDIKALNILGDRAPQYILAWEIFLKNKYTGIGLRNFMNIANYRNTIHSEYMVQLAECGIIGSIFFILFIGWILINLLRSSSKKDLTDKNKFMMSGALLAILFINFTAWTYSFPIYFSVYGIIIAFIKTQKNENCYSPKK